MKIRLFGIEFDNITMEETLVRIDHLVRDRIPSYVVTPNVDHVVLLHGNDVSFTRAYSEASLVLPDGKYIVWASRLAGKPLREKVSGSDLFPRVCEMAAARGYTVFFLGGKPTAAEKAAEVLAARFGGLSVTGTLCPRWGFETDSEENSRVIAAIKARKPDILFIGFGAPKQEIWVHRNLRDLNVPVSLCVGASFDFVSGIVKRAPLWMQNWGLEWFWRLLHEPGRLWKRYLISDLRFVSILAKEMRNIYAPTKN